VKEMVIEIGFVMLMLEGGEGGAAVENMTIMTGIGTETGRGAREERGIGIVIEKGKRKGIEIGKKGAEGASHLFYCLLVLICPLCIFIRVVISIQVGSFFFSFLGLKKCFFALEVLDSSYIS